MVAAGYNQHFDDCQSKVRHFLTDHKYTGENDCLTRSGTNCVEIIDLINPNSSSSFLDDRLKKIHQPYGGGLLENQPIIPGGYNINAKESFKSIIALGKQEESDEELKLFGGYGAASVVLKSNGKEKMWITGCVIGTAGGGATEFVSLGQPPTRGPDLPFAIHCHTMEYVDHETIYIIGGILNYNTPPSEKTWIVNPSKNFEITEGPSMQVGRFWHSSAIMNLNGRKIIVVVSGSSYYQRRMVTIKNNIIHGSPLNPSVELLDISSPNPKWVKGNYLLF